MISLYMAGNSWAHRMPARAKLLSLFAVSLLVIPFNTLWFSALMLAVVVVLYASLGKRGLEKLKAVRPLLWMMGIIFIVHVVLGDIEQGAIAVLRLLAMVLLANFISITTHMEALMDAVEPLFWPLRVFGLSSRRMSLAVALVIRFVPVLLAVYASLQEAYKARTTRSNSWRLLAPFALHAIKMTDHVAEALIARGGADGFDR
ncbi:Energy-coupling factor transporter transmembrane protein BioN [Pseudovibrio axinellae]|uniref:Energy-coupling factor transporter transmembrane protein BioN n=1 Tax=Pseudovibrio axinellae TaxID=989403 RepID=A0A166A3G2_9HYPH|nr:energy-coupling factor transporter transmembrane protein EcfT [Pseudovibrio axinellae]KZL20587.1 Energy-coupling factor transporter transmembrane protein BioN [Pseudovibrio axinellae]SER28533.1 biotin transport system permease protein [Pseudovibrio axinellae]